MARSYKITQKDTLKGIRKPMPPPQKPFKDKTVYKRKLAGTFKDYYGEATYADGQDLSIPAVQSETGANTNKPKLQYKIENLQFQPWNHSKRNEYVKEIYSMGVSPADALSKALIRIKMENSYTAPIGVIVDSAKDNHPIITLVPPPPEKKYWWQEVDEDESNASPELPYSDAGSGGGIAG